MVDSQLEPELSLRLPARMRRERWSLAICRSSLSSLLLQESWRAQGECEISFMA